MHLIFLYFQRELKLQDLKKKYVSIPIEIVTIYRTKPTFGVAIQGGSDTCQKSITVINIQVSIM
jgi:hypothetical protein